MFVCIVDNEMSTTPGIGPLSTPRGPHSASHHNSHNNNNTHHHNHHASSSESSSSLTNGGTSTATNASTSNSNENLGESSGAVSTTPSHRQKRFHHLSQSLLTNDSPTSIKATFFDANGEENGIGSSLIASSATTIKSPNKFRDERTTRKKSSSSSVSTASAQSGSGDTLISPTLKTPTHDNNSNKLQLTFQVPSIKSEPTTSLIDDVKITSDDDERSSGIVEISAKHHQHHHNQNLNRHQQQQQHDDQHGEDLMMAASADLKAETEQSGDSMLFSSYDDAKIKCEDRIR